MRSSPPTILEKSFIYAIASSDPRKLKRVLDQKANPNIKIKDVNLVEYPLFMWVMWCNDYTFNILGSLSKASIFRKRLS